MTNKYKIGGILKFALQVENHPILYALTIVAIWIISSLILYKITQSNNMAAAGATVIAGVIFLTISALAFEGALKNAFHKK